ncbi:MAG: hypothetical protein H6Q04_1691 [Acidobacteria bacterium]|nr:hypothetical protein [Acidobacteriota bacterium]
MAKYILLWEVDASRTPEDPKAKRSQWLQFHDVTIKDIKDGAIKEWGLFAGELCGYSIFEGSAVEVHTLAAKWMPFCKFKVSELLTIDESLKAAKALPE